MSQETKAKAAISPEESAKRRAQSQRDKAKNKANELVAAEEIAWREAQKLANHAMQEAERAIKAAELAETRCRKAQGRAAKALNALNVLRKSEPNTKTKKTQPPLIAIEREIDSDAPRFLWWFETGAAAVKLNKTGRSVQLRVQMSPANSNKHMMMMSALIGYLNQLAGYSVASIADSTSECLLCWSLKRKSHQSGIVFPLTDKQSQSCDPLALIDYENVNNLLHCKPLREYKEVLVLMGRKQEMLRLPGDVIHPTDTGMVFDYSIAVANKNKPFSRLVFSDSAKPISHFAATRIAAQGPNMLDIHVAFYLGVYMTLFPQKTIHIISNDKDYHALIHHVRKRTGTTQINQFHPNTEQWLVAP